jgi:hypothetical protein
MAGMSFSLMWAVLSNPQFRLLVMLLLLDCVVTWNFPVVCAGQSRRAASPRLLYEKSAKAATGATKADCSTKKAPRMAALEGKHGGTKAG